MKCPDFTEAACAELPVDLFFPDSREQEEKQKQMIYKVCANCPIFKSCLEYSLHVKVDGIWAGTTAQDRRVIRAKRGIKATPIYPIHEVFMSQTDEAKHKRKIRAAKSAETQKRNRQNA
jgi:hypothetical protein